MRGTHRIIVQNKRIRYDFEIKRNITVIRGESATGKTALVDMIREYDQNGPDSGIELKCDKSCTVLEGRNWKTLLAVMRDCIIFIDEGNDFVASKEFASMIQKSDNYYVLVTREGLAALPYSVEEIYGIRDSGKYGSLKRTYNELYHLYSSQKLGNKVTPQMVITEDSNSGFQFFQSICKKRKKECFSASGKSNIFSMLLQDKREQILVVADGAAFGSEMDKIVRLMKVNDRFTLYLPESFEWLVLNSGIIENNELKNILENPQDFIESSEYFSWEQFFTAVLIEKTGDSYLKYSKRILNPAYIHENITNQILQTIESVEF